MVKLGIKPAKISWVQQDTGAHLEFLQFSGTRMCWGPDYFDVLAEGSSLLMAQFLGLWPKFGGMEVLDLGFCSVIVELIRV